MKETVIIIMIRLNFDYDYDNYDYDLIQGKGNACKPAQYIVTLLLYNYLTTQTYNYCY